MLVRLHDLVSHLHHQLKGKIGLFDCNHGAVQVRAFAVQQLRHLGGGIALRALGLIIDCCRVSRNLPPRRSLGAYPISTGRMRMDEIELFMANLSFFLDPKLFLHFERLEPCS